MVQMTERSEIGSDGTGAAESWLVDVGAEARTAASFATEARTFVQNLARQRHDVTRDIAAFKLGLKRVGQVQTRLIWRIRIAAIRARFRLWGVSLAARMRLRALIVLTVLAGLFLYLLRIALVVGVVGVVFYGLLQLFALVDAYRAGSGG